MRGEGLEIGLDGDHAHFLIQSVPTYSTTKIALTARSLVAREVIARNEEVKELLWGGEFWGKGFFFEYSRPARKRGDDNGIG